MAGDLLAAFGRRLRRLRVERSLSQEQLAIEAGVNRTYLGDVERGERNIALENICRLASALGISPSELLADRDVEVAARRELRRARLR